MASRLIGRIILLIIAIIIFAIYKTMFCGIFPSNMVKTSGVIVSTCNDDKLLYEYSVANKKYRSRRTFCSSGDCFDLDRYYEGKEKITVYYKKNIPSFFVLKPEYRLSDFNLLFILIGVLILLITVVVINERKVANELFFNE